ncbi:hypothetical protein [Streptomyces narbonensis]|uniref:hypothetical protein n=1 Tax=Streptomyces narbonensis TaxID=67333 RepID=UPI001672455E|nr:hypothetical protein [Streptomyces narbonensis]GGV97407.1 hypothetical protein GCM10010230_17710 [Streptomyces narbonensis]
MNSGPDMGRTHARMLRVSTLALLLEAGVALAVLMTVGLSMEPEPGDDTAGGALVLLALPFVAVFGVLVAFAVSAVLILPVVLLGEDLGRKSGRDPLWWQLALAGLAGALLAPLAGVRGWIVGWTVLAVAVLLTRPARQGYFVSLLLWGTLAVVSVFMVGGIVLYAQG